MKDVTGKRKKYLLDTNVLLHDPNSITSFQEHGVLVPIEVIEELDRFKRESNELGRNARAVSRMLDGWRASGSKLHEGHTLPGGGRFRIVLGEKANGDSEHFGHNGNGNGHVDSMILRRAVQIKSAEPDVILIIVTKDVNLRLRADSIGIQSEDYRTDRVELSALYSGAFNMTVESAELARFNKKSEMDCPSGHGVGEYCHISDGDKYRLAKVDTEGRLVPIRDIKERVWGIDPRNPEQRFAFDALLDDRVKLVTLLGKAGTGKTLLALAAGLHQTKGLDGGTSNFRRVLVARPTISMGKEIGFLPGTLEEKLVPWMQPIHDALELLGDLNMGSGGRKPADLMREGRIVVEALSYIRGRSIPGQFIVIDEAQNLTPLEVKTIVTRVGQGTKIVFTGDPWQIDNPYVDASSNGFVYLIDRMRGQPLAAHVHLAKGERSELAELAANLL
jgi:PhoH-like ATPase